LPAGNTFMNFVAIRQQSAISPLAPWERVRVKGNCQENDRRNVRGTYAQAAEFAA